MSGGGKAFWSSAVTDAMTVAGPENGCSPLVEWIALAPPQVSAIAIEEGAQTAASLFAKDELTHSGSFMSGVSLPTPLARG